MKHLEAERARRWGESGLVLLFAGILLLICGCSSIYKVKNATMDALGDWGWGDKGSRVKQKIALIPFQNRTVWDENLSHALFMKKMVAALEEKGTNILLVTPKDPQFPPGLTQIFNSDDKKIDNIHLAKICRDAGINGVLTGWLNHISAEENKSGFLWFKKTKRVARVEIDVVAYQSGTAAKILDEAFFFDTDMIPADESGSSHRWIINEKVIEAPLSDAATSAAKMLSDKMGQIPWEGYVLSVDHGKLIIPSGQAVGLSLGDRLELFDGGKTIDIPGSYRYIVPGLKIGETAISSITPEMAEATVEGSAALKNGIIVRLKK